MGNKLSPEDWAAKVENEGGLYQAVTGYGLTHNDLDRADDPGFYDAVKAFVEATDKLIPYEQEVEAYLEEYGGW